MLVVSQSDTSTLVRLVGLVIDGDDHQKSGAPLVTRTPCCCTCCGSREIACWTLFWTWTWAMSGSIPLSKMTLMMTEPRERRRRAEIEQAVDAGQLLLEDLRDAALEGLGRGARDRSRGC